MSSLQSFKESIYGARSTSCEYFGDEAAIQYGCYVCRFSELTINMRQKDDLHYAEMMNRCRVGSPTDDDIRALMTRFISILSGKGTHWMILTNLLFKPIDLPI